MNNYHDLEEFDLLAKVYLIETEFGGRQGPVFDGYRGQFFWHINDVDCSDWDASYIFESGQANPGEKSVCKVVLSDNVKKYSKGVFPAERQFGIREGSKIIAVGIILESNVQNA